MSVCARTPPLLQAMASLIMSAPADEVTFDVKDRFMAACTTKRTAAGRAVLVEAMRRRELRCTRAVRVAAVTLLCARRIGRGDDLPRHRD